MPTLIDYTISLVSVFTRSDIWEYVLGFFCIGFVTCIIYWVKEFLTSYV